MKKQKLLIFLLMSLMAASAGAGVIFTDGFEDPVVPEIKEGYSWTFQGYNSDGEWPGWDGQGLKYAYVAHEDGGINLLNISGNQMMGLFNNLPDEDTGIAATTTAESLDTAIEANTTYSLTLKTASTFMPDEPWYPQDFHVQLVAIGDPNETVLAEAYGPVADNDFLSPGNQISLAYRSGDNPENLGERLAVRLKKGDGSYFHSVWYDDIRVSADTMNVSPYDGERVGYGPVDLSWTNLDPNIGDTVWVDVMFGTEPNIDEPGYNMTKIVVAGENVETTQVNALGGTTYYWQIISYLKGDTVTDPCESDVYSFTAVNDLPIQSAEILPGDMITWSGEPVQLYADVFDDGKSTVTYEWSCNLEEGVTFTGTNTANPTITITKDPGVGAVPLANAGFEEHVEKGGWWWWLNDGERDLVSDPQFGWSSPNWGYYYNPNSGIYNPNTSAYADGNAAEGRNVGFVESRMASTSWTAAGGLWQNADAVLEPGVEYTLSVKVGNPLYNDAFPGYRVQLLAKDGGSNVLLAEDENTIPIAPGTFETSTVKFTAPDTHDQLGNRLRIQLATTADIVSEENATTIYEVHFDDVKLTTDDGTTIKVNLVVKDDVTPSVTDTITIDTYDNACKAKIATGAEDNPGDINEDCVTDIDDAKMVASGWLESSELEEPFVTNDSYTRGDPENITVNAGENVHTWSGETIQLSPTIVDGDPNDPPVDFIYKWSADTQDGVVFDPNDPADPNFSNVLAPTITITKEPGDVKSVQLSLAVNKEGSAWDDVVSPVWVNVYDNPCQAMIGADQIFDSSDLNGDCITNLNDLATLSEAWLVDIGVLTEPAVKPSP